MQKLFKNLLMKALKISLKLQKILSQSQLDLFNLFRLHLSPSHSFSRHHQKFIISITIARLNSLSHFALERHIKSFFLILFSSWTASHNLIYYSHDERAERRGHDMTRWKSRRRNNWRHFIFLGREKFASKTFKFIKKKFEVKNLNYKIW
jgi:hypothetical protein